MLPFIQWTTIQLGPVTIQVWGLFVALGMGTALWLAVREAGRRGLNPQTMLDLGFWMILGSLIGGRLLYVVSEWPHFASDLVEIVRVWDGGMAMSGGVFGAMIAGYIVLRRRGQSWLAYGDVAAFVLPLGIAIGRLGCFFIFDHPGSSTSFWLGQVYADGIVRHNHGLYLAIDGLVLCSLFLYLRHRNSQRQPGVYIIWYLIWDGIVRLLLDTLRATDVAHPDARYLSLTAAQYSALLMLAAGALLWYYLYHGTPKTHSQTEALR